MLRRMISDDIRNDPGWKDGEYETQPRGLGAAVQILLVMISSPLQAHAAAPTPAAADRLLAEQTKARYTGADANDFLYAFEASRDYDPSGALEKIQAPLLAINSADDVVNPLNTVWVLVTAFLVFFMQAGFMMLEAGFGRKDPPIRLGQLQEALIRLVRFVVSIRLHAEDLSVTDGAEANDGFVATVLGLRGWPAAAEEMAVTERVADERREEPVLRLVVRRHEGHDQVRRHAVEPRAHRRGRLVDGGCQPRGGRCCGTPPHRFVPSTDPRVMRTRFPSVRPPPYD